MDTRRLRGFVAWTIVLAGLGAVLVRGYEADVPKRAHRGLQPPPPPVDIVRGAFERNATLSTTLAAFGLRHSVVYEISEAVRPVFDVRRFRPGQEFTLVRDPAGDFIEFEYAIDEESTLKVERVEDGLRARREQLPLDVHVDTVAAEVNSSLWNALAGYARGDRLVVELDGVFRSRVDFYRDIRAGDRIRVLIEGLYHQGRFVKYGRVLAAEFVNQGRSFQAYRFGDEYYDENGMSTRRSLLPAPLEFSRISSGFSNARLHPILNTVRAHRGVDYAAPAGTPVMAAADGTVTFAGANGNYGRFVRIRHGSGEFVTEYAHLSRILVGVGQRVRQEDVIGRVGMTGLATGPHLHYQLMQDGRYIDPRRARVDPPQPIDEALRADFMRTMAPHQVRLAALDGRSALAAEE